MEMEELHKPQLNIELGCQLFIQSKLIDERIATSLIGIVPQSGLIIKTPPMVNADEVLSIGKEIVLRYVYLGEVFGFKSKIINSTSVPFQLTFITYPENIERLCLRKNKRIMCNFPATLHLEETQIKGMVVDISILGALFISKKNGVGNHDSLQMDSDIKLHIPLFGDQQISNFHGRIKNFSHDMNGVRVGIQFIHIDPDVSSKIEDYIQQVFENI